MDKDIKDYLKYYIGQSWQVTQLAGTFESGIYGTDIFNSLLLRELGLGNVTVKPILRKLESMTEEELRWYFDSIKRPEDELDCFEWVTEQNGQPVDHPHWIMWCKDQTWARHGYVLGGSEERYEPKQFDYLLSRGFDLFGLIESGAAINKDQQ